MIAALDGGHRLFQREGGRGAQQPVADDIEARARVSFGFPLRHIRQQDRRGVINRWIDGAVLCPRMTPEMGEERILAIFSAAVDAFHKRYTPSYGYWTSKLHRFGRKKQNARSAWNYAGEETLGLPRISGLYPGREGGTLVKPAILGALMVALAACSSST